MFKDTSSHPNGCLHICLFTVKLISPCFHVKPQILGKFGQAAEKFPRYSVPNEPYSSIFVALNGAFHLFDETLSMILIVELYQCIVKMERKEQKLSFFALKVREVTLQRIFIDSIYDLALFCNSNNIWTISDYHPCFETEWVIHSVRLEALLNIELVTGGPKNICAMHSGSSSMTQIQASSLKSKLRGLNPSLTTQVSAPRVKSQLLGSNPPRILIPVLNSDRKWFEIQPSGSN